MAISQEGLGEALRRSSAAMAAGNNSLSETIALLATANEVKYCPLYWWQYKCTENIAGNPYLV